MTKNYEKLAKDIINSLGGSENITEAYHCQTRLRFKVIDEKKSTKKKLKI